jgi:uncharacterized protein with PQ loop repeat
MSLIKHQHVIDKIAFVNGLISGIALYPQVWATIVHHSGHSVSLLSFSLIFINSVVWFLYSIHRSLLTLAITSILNCVASGIMVSVAILF